MNIDKKDKLALLLGMSLPISVLIGIALFISPQNAIPLTSFGTVIVAGTIALVNGDDVGNTVKKIIPKNIL